MILLLDNYDSFVHNLARYCERLEQRTVVVRNDQIDLEAIEQLDPQAIILSPGPCTPCEAGCSLDVVRQLHTKIPLLGVCLGHQAIAAALGGNVIRAREPMHGRSSPVFHQNESVFAGLPNPLTACRYHSLVVESDTLPDCLTVTAATSDGTIMGLAHRQYPVVGVQFHPESILTTDGYPLLANFFRIAGIPLPVEPLDITSELAAPAAAAQALPTRPVTF